MYGSHLSIAGGMHNALAEAETLGMQTVQVFTKNQQQWKAKPLDPDAVRQWKGEQRRLAFERTVSHVSYLINLGSPDDALWLKSIDLLCEELRRCVTLGIPLMVMHPGAHTGSGEEAGLRRIANGINKCHAAVRSKRVMTCLEITAGSGSVMGYKLEHLADIIAMVKRPERMGICIDTAHAFAAGYDFRGRKYQRFMKQIDATVGLDRVLVWHLNDSRKELGSRVDRHEHIGKGFIGLDGFKPIIRDPRWRDIPKILETPKEQTDDGREWDAVNLEVLRGMER